MNEIDTIAHDVLPPIGPEYLLAFAPSRASKSIGLAVPTWFGAGAAIVDVKASTWAVSRTRAKKRLMAAGLAPAAAAAVVRAASAELHWFQGGALVDAMKHHRRHSKRWFPSDTLIVAGHSSRWRRR